jgi:uncharacterized membrane protein YdjX (TVP38/TMEM64 family)
MDSSTPSIPEPGEPVVPIEPAPSAEGCVKGWVRQLGPAGPLAAVMILLPVVGGLALLGFLNRLGPWLKAHESLPVVGLSALIIAGLIGFSLVPTYMLEILAGWAFGATAGLVAAVAGVTGAAVIGYTLSHAIVKGQVLKTVHEHPRCEAVRRAMLDSGPFKAGLIVALLRLAPVVPFGATNLLMASAGCPMLPFAVGTALGSIPRTAAIVLVAAEMSQLSFRQEPGLLVMSLVATVIVVGVIGLLAKKALAQVTGAVDVAPRRSEVSAVSPGDA